MGLNSGYLLKSFLLLSKSFGRILTIHIILNFQLIDTFILYTRYFCNFNLHLSANLEKKSIENDNIYNIRCFSSLKQEKKNPLSGSIAWLLVSTNSDSYRERFLESIWLMLRQ